MAAAVEANIEYSKRLQSRLERASQLAEFARDCGRSIRGVLTELGWSAEGEGLGLPPQAGSGAQPEPPDPVVICPFDADHRLLKSSLEKHVASCRLRKLEYSREEEAAMCDPLFAYEKTLVPTFKMDKDLQTQIIQQAKRKAPLGKEERVFSQGDYSSVPPEVPENHKRFICDLTPADRLAIYEHVVKETSHQRTKSIENDGDLYVDLAAKLSRDDEQRWPKSHLEILAEMRDYKRRRQSYRAKNVHITKKSYTEIIKDVINVHMEQLSRQWNDQNDYSNTEEYDDQNTSLSLKSSAVSCRRRSGDDRSPSIESQSTGSTKSIDHDSRRKNHTQSPHERKRSPNRAKERVSRKRREKEHHTRDEDRHRSHKRRK
ncbi:U11/U12 small nuclear ribonucleoprotein 48 kDa protein [Scyliorhinus canicula]|uniref:U11/U12 small nuclear ribonucleoprotein 48 kDa protein n=1 Tax=Scyliorhinus canicula TaxID=7830 RepID=UPI0018F52BAF|nr:U11/U12 small nuclear ribonucleoprotein 48 kDa protein [Scyliorhinus canicula]